MLALTPMALVAPALPLLGFGLPGGPEWIIILVVALLIFGRRLPDVARSIGKSIVEFKKGINEVKDDIQIQSTDAPPKQIGQVPAGQVPAGQAPAQLQAAANPPAPSAPPPHNPAVGSGPAVSPAPADPSASNDNNPG